MQKTELNKRNSSQIGSKQFSLTPKAIRVIRKQITHDRIVTFLEVSQMTT